MTAPTQPPSNPTPHNAPHEAPTDSRLGKLVDNLRAVENKDRETVEILAANWQKIAGGVVVVLLFVWVIQRFQESENLKLSDASARFSDVQESFAGIQNALPKPSGTDPAPAEAAKPDVEKSRTIFRENMVTLHETHGSSVYTTLSEFYLAREEAESGKIDAAKKRLATLAGDLAQGKAQNRKLLSHKEILPQELAALYLARLRLGLPEERAEAKKSLEALALNARIVPVEAALALKRSSRDETERAEAEKFISTLKTSRPELADILNQESAARGAGAGMIPPQ